MDHTSYFEQFFDWLSLCKHFALGRSDSFLIIFLESHLRPVSNYPIRDLGNVCILHQPLKPETFYCGRRHFDLWTRFRKKLVKSSTVFCCCVCFSISIEWNVSLHSLIVNLEHNRYQCIWLD